MYAYLGLDPIEHVYLEHRLDLLTRRNKAKLGKSSKKKKRELSTKHLTPLPLLVGRRD